MTSLCLVFKHKTLMFRGTFVFNKWGARAIEMPSQCELPFHSRAMCVAGGLNYLLHSHQPPFTSPPCSTQPPIQSTSRQEAGPLLRGSRICSGTTAAGSFNSSTPRLPLVTLVTTSRQKTQIQRRPSIVGCVETVCPSKALLTLLILHWSLYWGWRECCRGICANDIWRDVNTLLTQS